MTEIIDVPDLTMKLFISFAD